MKIQNTGSWQEKNGSRQYTWNKGWVRPYESPTSAYLNFCNINALTYSNIVQYWRCGEGGVLKFDRDLGCHVQAGRGFIKKFKDCILPENFCWFPEIQGAFNYKRTFHFCPECIKQGYHSLLSQLPSEEVCPIHGTPYIDTHINIPIGYRGTYDTYRDILGLFPLPQERIELDYYSKISERINNVISDTRYIGYIAPKANEFYESYYKGILQEGRREEIASFVSAREYEELIDFVWQYFLDGACDVFTRKTLVNGMENDSVEDYFCHFRQNRRLHDNINGRMYKIMEFACMLDYIKNEDRKSYPGIFPHIRECRPEECTADNTSAIKASYCYAVRGCVRLEMIFSFDYILKPYSEAYLIEDTFSTNLERIDSEVEELNRLRPLDTLRPSQIRAMLKAICVYDQFWYQSIQYWRDIHKRGSFDFYGEWKNIPPIIYEVRQDAGGKIFVYRITGSDKRGHKLINFNTTCQDNN